MYRQHLTHKRVSFHPENIEIEYWCVGWMEIIHITTVPQNHESESGGSA